MSEKRSEWEVCRLFLTLLWVIGSLQKKSTQLSKPLISLKVPPATSLSHSSTHSRDWDDLITTHVGSSYAEVWSTRNQRKGRHQLAATAKEKVHQMGQATASCLSSCGNFAMIGNSLGFVEVYYIESGRYRQRLDTRRETVEKMQRKKKGGGVVWREERVRGKGSAITGIVSDSLNRTIVVSTMQGGLHFFDFHTGQANHYINTQVGISALHLDRSTNLCAALQDDLTIKIYDIESCKMVRLLGGFSARVLDVCFSSDGKWLIASSLDGYVRTFDIPTSRLVDYFKTHQVATSVSFSPLGDFLATTHVGSKGIYLWANRNQYLNLALSGIDEDEMLLHDDEYQEEELPTLRGIDVEELAQEDWRLHELDVGEAEYSRLYTSKPQLFIDEGQEDGKEAGLITLSTMPRSRWMTLLNLDVIKARNKPKEAPKKPERAPFFLAVGASAVPDSALRRNDNTNRDFTAEQGEPTSDSSKRLQTLSRVGVDLESDFARRLQVALEEAHGIDLLFDYLHSLTPPALDSEIRSLARVPDVTAFLQCMTGRLRQHLDYDAIQAMLAVALQIHSTFIIEHGTKVIGGEAKEADEGQLLGQALRELMIEQHKEANRVLELLQYCMGSLEFIR